MWYDQEEAHSAGQDLPTQEASRGLRKQMGKRCPHLSVYLFPLLLLSDLQL